MLIQAPILIDLAPFVSVVVAMLFIGESLNQGDVTQEDPYSLARR
jgi:hypothetical protein